MNVRRTATWLCAATVILAPSAAAPASDEAIEPQRGPDTVDVVSTRQIREHTTDPSYLTEWVDYVPESETVPSPRDFLGHVAGADPGMLARRTRQRFCPICQISLVPLR